MFVAKLSCWNKTIFFAYMILTLACFVPTLGAASTFMIESQSRLLKRWTDFNNKRILFCDLCSPCFLSEESCIQVLNYNASALLIGWTCPQGLFSCFLAHIFWTCLKLEQHDYMFLWLRHRNWELPRKCFHQLVTSSWNILKYWDHYLPNWFLSSLFCILKWPLYIHTKNCPPWHNPPAL